MVQSSATDRASPETIWKRLEPLALDFILNQAHIILTNRLWMVLQDFLNELQKLTPDTLLPSNWPISQWTKDNKSDVVEFAQLFIGQPPGARERGFELLAPYQLDLSDLFIALLIMRRGGPSNLDAIIRSRQLWDAAELLGDNPTLQEIADRIRVIALIKTGPAALVPPTDTKAPADVQSAVQAAFQKAMNATLLFPRGIFAPFEKPVHGVGFREFHVVKQHIRGYEFGEIAKIENILKGETRDHATKHTLSNERDTFTQTTATTETDKELTSTDHVNIQNEAQNQVKEDTKVDAGVHAQYDSGGSFKMQADLTVSYDKSTDDSKKFASDVAKDVTQKAATKVTEQITQNQTTKIVETFEETEDQSFDNKAGTEHISGVYQWVEKVYLAQTFNLGRHLLFDLMVPEPAASLLALTHVPPVNQEIPVQPDPLGVFHVDKDTKKKILDKPLTPDQLVYDDVNKPNFDVNNPNFYGKWIAKYQVTGVDPVPEAATVSKAIAADHSDYKEDDIKYSDTIKVDDGYKASSATVSVTFRPRENKDGGNLAVLSVQLGQRQFNFGGEDATKKAILGTIPTSVVSDRNRVGNLDAVPNHSRQLNGEESSLPVTVFSVRIDEATLNIEVQCEPTAAAFAQWQLKTYDKIVTAWQKLQSDYESKMAALQFQKGTAGLLSTADPEANRLTERIELKRGCIAILDNNNGLVRGTNAPVIEWQDTATPPLTLPEPILDQAETHGSWVRWFEQAFEWENMAYVFYPYYWGRRRTWIDRLNQKNDDPLFLNFLQAGYARVVVPVRLGFEWATIFYLHTGLPWLGGGLPPIGDKTQNPLYLDVAEEIKAITGGGDHDLEIPIGDPWEFNLPTTLIKLQDDQVPSWTRVGPNGKPDPNFPADPPPGPWTWGEENPPKPLPYSTS